MMLNKSSDMAENEHAMRFAAAKNLYKFIKKTIR